MPRTGEWVALPSAFTASVRNVSTLRIVSACGRMWSGILAPPMVSRSVSLPWSVSTSCPCGTRDKAEALNEQPRLSLGWDGMGWDVSLSGMGWDGMYLSLGWDEMGCISLWDRMGWDVSLSGMGWDGMYLSLRWQLRLSLWDELCCIRLGQRCDAM